MPSVRGLIRHIPKVFFNKNEFSKNEFRVSIDIDNAEGQKYFMCVCP